MKATRKLSKFDTSARFEAIQRNTVRIPVIDDRLQPTPFVKLDAPTPRDTVVFETFNPVAPCLSSPVFNTRDAELNMWLDRSNSAHKAMQETQESYEAPITPITPQVEQEALIEMFLFGDIELSDLSNLPRVTRDHTMRVGNCLRYSIRSQGTCRLLSF